jgi:hypothetical protein
MIRLGPTYAADLLGPGHHGYAQNEQWHAGIIIFQEGSVSMI